jgi:TonB family protein
MFDVLPESGTHRAIRHTWLTTSIAAHALLVVVAVMATRGALEATRTTVQDEPMPLFVPEPAPEVGKTVPDIVVEPPGWRFHTLPIPGDIPPAIPPIDFDRRPFDPGDFAGIGHESEIADGSVDDTGGDSNAIYEATTGIVGFEPAVLLAQPQPEYPATLRSAGLAGVVLLEFVIDTIGKVEAGSIRVIEGSHPAFEAAARRAVLGARFRPARVGQHPVRQLSQQRIRFVAR